LTRLVEIRDVGPAVDWGETLVAAAGSAALDGLATGVTHFCTDFVHALRGIERVRHALGANADPDQEFGKPIRREWRCGKRRRPSA
jgi:hypothetical protein